MSPMTNGIAWFEIGTDDPAGILRFYGELFGWTFAEDADGGLPYQIVTTPAEQSIKGGVFSTSGRIPNYAVFCVLVDDVADTVRRAEATGGKVLVPATRTADGLTFAHLLDPSGSQFGVFTPPPGAGA
jgi:uncharacterized protein